MIGAKSEKLLTVREVAELFRVEPRTVYRWIKANRVRVVETPGGQYRVPADSVSEEWESQVVNEPKVSPTAP